MSDCPPQLFIFPVPLHEIPHDLGAANVRRVLPAEWVPVAVDAVAVDHFGPSLTSDKFFQLGTTLAHLSMR